MKLTPTQKDFLLTMVDCPDGQLHLYQIAQRMTKRLSQPTIDRLMGSGLLEYGSGRTFRITETGRAALTE